MNKSSKKIIKSLLLSAAFTLLHGQNANAESKPALSLSFDGLDDNNQELQKGKNPILNNVYKILRNGDVSLIAAHRSHSSHRSHRSHSSHRSGSSHYSHSSSSYSGGSTTYTAPKKTPATYSIGDRTLKQGVHGADVNQLVSYLISNFYINESLLKKNGEYYIYDSNVVEAVKHFQKDAKMEVTGHADYSTYSQLKSWDSDNTTITLGIREVKIGTSGYDVDELIKMLTTAGFAPDPQKLHKVKQHYEFTEDIMMAVKMFQAYNKMEATGLVDDKTIKKLKKFSK